MKKYLTAMVLSSMIISTGLYAKEVDSSKPIKKITKKTKVDNETAAINERVNLLLKKFEKSANKKIKEKKEINKKMANNNVSNKIKAVLPQPYKSILIGKHLAVFAHYYEPKLQDNSTPEDNTLSAETRESDKMLSGFGGDAMNRSERVANGMLDNPRAKMSTGNESSLKYEVRDIRLYKGSEFGNWKVDKLSLHYVIYKNINNKKTVKKYY